MRREPKRTRAGREEALLEVARLDALGYATRAIGDKLGVSHTQIEYDLKIIKRRYAEATLEERHAKVVEKIAQRREVRRQAWEAWRNRKRTAKKRSRRRSSIPPLATASRPLSA